jgi:hypothetical protein
MAIFKVLGILYLAGFLLASLLGINFIVKEKRIDIVKIFLRYFILWWALDLALRYMWQQLPTNNIKPDGDINYAVSFKFIQSVP